MSGLFTNCSNLIELSDISNWEIGNKNNDEKFFNFNLIEGKKDFIYYSPNEKKKDYEPNYGYIRYMFNECESLTKLPDISK